MTSTWFNSSAPKTVLNAITTNSPKLQNAPNARISSIATVTVLIAQMDSLKLSSITLNSVSNATQHADNAQARKLQIAWLVLTDLIWGISFMTSIALNVCIWLRMEMIQRALSNVTRGLNVWWIIRFKRYRQALSARNVWDLRRTRLWAHKVVGFVGYNKTWQRVIASQFLREGINCTEVTFLKA